MGSHPSSLPSQFSLLRKTKRAIALEMLNRVYRPPRLGKHSVDFERKNLKSEIGAERITGIGSREGGGIVSEFKEGDRGMRVVSSGEGNETRFLVTRYGKTFV